MRNNNWRFFLNESPIDIFTVRSDICNLYDMAFCLTDMKHLGDRYGN